jgi:hypothetical protein
MFKKVPIKLNLMPEFFHLLGRAKVRYYGANARSNSLIMPYISRHERATRHKRIKGEGA